MNEFEQTISDPDAISSAARHFDELGVLWAVWRQQLKSNELTINNLEKLETRLRAHIDGVFAGNRMAVQIALDRLRSIRSEDTFAAAYLLMRRDRANAVMVAFEQSADSLSGIRHALCHSPIDEVEEQLNRILDEQDSLRASAAAEVLAFHGKLDYDHPRITQFFKDQHAAIRSAAWRMVTYDPR